MLNKQSKDVEKGVRKRFGFINWWQGPKLLHVVFTDHHHPIDVEPQGPSQVLCPQLEYWLKAHIFRHTHTHRHRQVHAQYSTTVKFWLGGVYAASPQAHWVLYFRNPVKKFAFCFHSPIQCLCFCDRWHITQRTLLDSRLHKQINFYYCALFSFDWQSHHVPTLYQDDCMGHYKRRIFTNER